MLSNLVEMMPSDVGARAEAAVLAALVRMGKKVLVPFGGCQRYDLAYDDEDRLVKVQCKSGRERNGAIVFRTYSVGRGPAADYRADADVFGIYCYERAEVYLVPVEDVPPRAAHLRLVPARNGQHSGIRLATRYLVT